MPEHAELVALTQTRAELDNQVRDARIVVEDLTADQLKADQDVELVKARRTRDQDRIDQGVISNPKDLERMQHELVSLDRRIGVLEDEELEIMERLEDAQRTLDSLAAQLTAVDERGRSLVAARDEQTAVLDASLAECAAERDVLIADLPADLLALYDRLRVAKDGVGAAELRQRQCAGCRLTVDNLELAKIKALPSDEVVRCEECQRILVRTAESGL
ncbi:MAG: zinc ribbon domain-containing protein [Nocardioides sp.]